jgi:hypothetical protein
LREVDALKTRLEAAKTAGVAGGSKRKRQDADVVPYSREVMKKKGRKEMEEKREVFLGGLVIEEVDAGEGDEGGEFFSPLLFFSWLVVVAGD